MFDEDSGLETLAIGPRGAAARALLRTGVPACSGKPFPCATLATLATLDGGYSRALTYLGRRFPKLPAVLGRAFVAATDTFVRVFMTTMATEALRYGVYIAASNTQAPFALTRDPAAVAALRDPATPQVRAVYAPTAGVAYDQTFLWGPRVVSRRVAGTAREPAGGQPQAPADQLRAGARLRNRSCRWPRRGRKPAAVHDPRHRRSARVRHQPAGVHIRTRDAGP